MNKTNLLIIGAIFFFFTVSCSSMMKGKGLAEPAVDKFHKQLNAEEYDEIYDEAGDAFKKSVTKEQLVRLLSAVREKLGRVNKSTSTGWKVNTDTSGTITTISCDVDFAEGKGTEEFKFEVTDDKALLYNYKVNSPLLATK